MRLKPTQINSLKPGLHNDGSNLYCQVTENPTSGKIRRSWIFRYAYNGKTRDMGLGSTSKIGLSAARGLAAEQLIMLQRGDDPIHERRVRRGELAATKAAGEMSLLRATNTYLASNKSAWSPGYVEKWQRSFEIHLYPKLKNKLVGEITKEHIVEVLTPVFNEAPAQGKLVQMWLCQIMAWCIYRGYSKLPNPAEWNNNLEFEFRYKQKETEHHGSLPYQGAPAFYKALGDHRGIAPIAIKFILLTGVRANEALKAEWSEIDFENKLWTVPANRMKTRKTHRVPLSDEAISLLRSIMGYGSNYVFPGYKGKHLNDTVIRELKKKLPFDTTIHGLRSTLRTWCDEQTSYAHEVKEQTLAHQIKNEVERAYVKSELLNQRRNLLNDWAIYLIK